MNAEHSRGLQAGWHSPAGWSLSTSLAADRRRASSPPALFTLGWCWNCLRLLPSPHPAPGGTCWRTPLSTGTPPHGTPSPADPRPQPEETTASPLALTAATSLPTLASEAVLSPDDLSLSQGHCRRCVTATRSTLAPTSASPLPVPQQPASWCSSRVLFARLWRHPCTPHALLLWPLAGAFPCRVRGGWAGPGRRRKAPGSRLVAWLRHRLHCQWRCCTTILLSRPWSRPLPTAQGAHWRARSGSRLSSVWSACGDGGDRGGPPSELAWSGVLASKR